MPISKSTEEFAPNIMLLSGCQKDFPRLLQKSYCIIVLKGFKSIVGKEHAKTFIQNQAGQ